MIEAPKLFTSHWRSPLLADADVTIVSISRGQPRWPLPFRYRKLSELAPNNQTWAHEDTEAFERSYLRQLDELGAEAILADLRRIGEEHGGKPLCLLCWEKLADPTEFCHRRVLAGFLRAKKGMEVPELEHGMLGKRPDSPEPRLFI